jgi:3-deoxy-D-manno-octulosonic-acid transferase
MGELRKFYSLARAVFVGRSLAAMGGSDPMEVAALGKPMIAGPHMENFQQPFETLRDAESISTVHDAASLAEIAMRYLSDSEAARAAGERAREVVRRNQGATRQTADRLVELFNVRVANRTDQTT